MLEPVYEGEAMAFVQSIRLRVAARAVCVFVTTLALAAIASPVRAQVQLGGIDGTVTDESGSVLPGVSVTITSPALQVQSLVSVTDSEGRYRFADLRVGSYRVQSELSGFSTFVRESVQIDSGFVARVDIRMKVGSLEETITVSGASPVVDVTTTRGGQVLDTAATQKLIPVGANTHDLIRLVPGLAPMTSSAANIGKMGLQGLATASSAYGGDTSEVWVDEFRLTFPLTVTNLGDTAQMDVRTFGSTANVIQPGGVVNYVLPTGGNQFHGRAALDYINGNLQGNNIDDVLRAQKFKNPDSLNSYRDFHGSIGGFIVKNTLWFQASARERGNNRAIGGSMANAGPDGIFGTGDEPPIGAPAEQNGQTLKLSYQISSKYSLSGMYWRDWSLDQVSVRGFFGTNNPLTTPLESTNKFGLDSPLWYVGFRGTPTNNLTFEGQAGEYVNDATYQPPNINTTTTPTYNRNTGQYTGQQISDGIQLVPDRRGKQSAPQFRGSLTYVPKNGDHTFQLGARLLLPKYETTLKSACCGDYYRIFDTVGGAPNTPVQLVTITGLPLFTTARFNNFGAYAQDQWRIGRRLTANVGVRWDRLDTWLPAQTTATGISYPRIDTGTWSDKIAPRVGVAWDVLGDAKTVVKTFYGKFFVEPAYSNSYYNQGYNPNTALVSTYTWHDVNGDKQYQPGEVDLRTTGGTDFVSQTGGLNSVVNKNLNLISWQEVSTSVEHELIENMAVRVLYVHKQEDNLFSATSPAVVGRPYSAYDIPLQRKDPGPDGVLGTGDDGGFLTIYDYQPAYRGAAFNQVSIVNQTKPVKFNTVEFSVTKRLANNWTLGSSYSRTKINDPGPVVTNPNAAINSGGTYVRNALRLNGGYELPFGISSGAVLIVNTGVQGQRTYLFRAADPLGGPSLVQLSGGVNVNLEPLNSRNGPTQTRLDLRASKLFRLKSHEAQVNLDVLNATNANFAQALTFASGPTFGQITAIPTPISIQFGVQFRF
jgi:hypothetical protein